MLWFYGIWLVKATIANVLFKKAKARLSASWVAPFMNFHQKKYDNKVTIKLLLSIRDAT